MDPLRGKLSPWKRVLHRFQARRDVPFRRKFFVGYDLEGNSYWEWSLDGNQNQRLRRKVEPRVEQEYKVDYYESIPVQWLQWLRFTRNHVPTIQELVMDEQRKVQIKILAKQAEQKWHAEKEAMELEHNLKLNRELDKVKNDPNTEEVMPNLDKINKHFNQSTEYRTSKVKENPWKAAKQGPSDPIQSATIKPRRE